MEYQNQKQHQSPFLQLIELIAKTEQNPVLTQPLFSTTPASP